METEPSHFYMAKHSFVRGVYWDRTMPDVLTAEIIADTFEDGNYDFLVVPGKNVIFPLDPGALLAPEFSGRLALERGFTFHGNTLYLFSGKRKKADERT